MGWGVPAALLLAHQLAGEPEVRSPLWTPTPGPPGRGELSRPHGQPLPSSREAEAPLWEGRVAGASGTGREWGGS